jgi:hypothetical protein
MIFCLAHKATLHTYNTNSTILQRTKRTHHKGQLAHAHLGGVYVKAKGNTHTHFLIHSVELCCSTVQAAAAAV